jgi:predicted membrane-bound spermidine synthase
VLTKLFPNPTLVDLVLEPKSVMVQQEIICGFMNTLTVMKNLWSFMKLTIKHALLVAIINNVDTFSFMK